MRFKSYYLTNTLETVKTEGKILFIFYAKMEKSLNIAILICRLRYSRKRFIQSKFLMITFVDVLGHSKTPKQSPPVVSTVLRLKGLV